MEKIKNIKFTGCDKVSLIVRGMESGQNLKFTRDGVIVRKSPAKYALKQLKEAEEIMRRKGKPSFASQNKALRISAYSFGNELEIIRTRLSDLKEPFTEPGNAKAWESAKFIPKSKTGAVPSVEVRQRLKAKRKKKK